MSRTLDHFKRPLRDLRISVTDRCNFRCQYCMPKEIFDKNYPYLSRQQLLTNDEVSRLATIFAQLGVEKLRITGGEPMLRPHLLSLIERLNEINGIQDVAMTTNGSLLPKKAQALKAAGLNRITVSLDSLCDERFAAINDQGFSASKVLEGIQAAREAGLDVKLNVMVQKGVNDDELADIVGYFRGTGVIVRFIEYMDVGSTNGWKPEDVFGKKDILSTIEQTFQLIPVDPNYYGEVATRYKIKGSDDEIGIISSVTDAFCTTCTRARLSADGAIYTCLFSENGTSLRNPMRNGATDEELYSFVESVWNHRKDRYSLERHLNRKKPRKNIEMSYIGG